MGLRLLAAWLILGPVLAVLGGCGCGEGPNDPVVKPSDQTKMLENRMTPEERARHTQPKSDARPK